MLSPCQGSTLLPYTTLFRSVFGNLFEGNGPLSTFSGRNLIAFSARLISQVRYNRLEVIREDRNRFAHNVFAKQDRKSTLLNSSHLGISYAVFCLKKTQQYLA